MLPLPLVDPGQALVMKKHPEPSHVCMRQKAQSFSRLKSRPMNYYRLLRVFRAITSIKAFGGVKAIITTLFKGSGQLLTVLAMLIFFMSAFAIAGMSIFGLSFRRRCVTIERAIPACTSDFDSGWGQTCNITTDARGGVIDGEWGMAMNPGGDIMMVISPLHSHSTSDSCFHSRLSAPLTSVCG